MPVRPLGLCHGPHRGPAAFIACISRDATQQRSVDVLTRKGVAFPQYGSLNTRRSSGCGRARSACYAAAKAAVVAFTKSLAEETAPRLRANCVSPGFVETPLAQGVIDDLGSDL